MSLMIKNATILNGDELKKEDIYIDGCKIVDVKNPIFNIGAEEVIDLKNKYLVIPGFVDVHVHLREPGFSYKETIKTGTMAAASAGYTAVCAMPNLNPVPDCPENLKVEADIIKKDAVIDVFPFASITRGRLGCGECVDFNSLKDLVIGFSDDGAGVQEGKLMREAMQKCAAADSIISAHCEVNSLVNGGYINEGKYCREHGHRGISAESEWREIERDCKLAKETGCRYHVCHVSTKESVEIIRNAKKDGINVTCETAPHYLILTEENLQDKGIFKMNPPLRSKVDRDALIEGLTDGTIDVIATDHAPHSDEEKSKGLRDSAMGVSGIEVAFPVLYTKLVKNGVISLKKLIEMMCINPRRIFGIKGGKIESGYIADLAVLDLDYEWQIKGREFISKGKATPFEGMNVNGKNVMTIKGGRIVYDKRI